MPTTQHWVQRHVGYGSVPNITCWVRIRTQYHMLGTDPHPISHVGYGSVPNITYWVRIRTQYHILGTDPHPISHVGYRSAPNVEYWVPIRTNRAKHEFESKSNISFDKYCSASVITIGQKVILTLSTFSTFWKGRLGLLSTLTFC